MSATRLFPALLVISLLASSGCDLDFAEPLLSIGDADLRILYIGNSLTAANELPQLVEALATRAGTSVAWNAVVQPGFNLLDHWNTGVRAQIEAVGADVVVLQQGPSTLIESAAVLHDAAEKLAPVIRAAGGEPAFFMVWPDESRIDFFMNAYQSYRDAALAVEGLFIPAGRTWIESWTLDPSLDLYGPDRFHPSYLGSLAAAQTITAVLLDLEPTSIPALDDGVEPDVVATLRSAVAASVAF